MCACMILADSNALVRIFENSTSVAICIEIIWCRENGDHRREFLCGGLTEHDIAIMQLAHEVDRDSVIVRTPHPGPRVRG
jgi:hypothetical protein